MLTPFRMILADYINFLPPTSYFLPLIPIQEITERERTMSIYLDNSATTRVCSQAADAMVTCMREEFYNPSALYAPPWRRRKP